MNQNSKHILFTWVGHTDLKCMQQDHENELGPIAQAVDQRDFDQIELIIDSDSELPEQYKQWLQDKTKSKVNCHTTKLSSPVNFGEIYQVVTTIIDSIRKQQEDRLKITFHLSPGTPAMAAVWIILAKTRYAAELIESSREHGVNTANIPFDISAEFIPDLIRQADKQITDLNTDKYEITEAFKSIIHQSSVMKSVIQKAQQIAPRTLPVLIEGESGTGKELLSRSIHKASLRNEKPFIAVNCGAINKELAESEFFGHKKGAFTGATIDRKGYFEEAHQGTLFLDEIGELPLELQVKLLRVLQEQEVTPVGATKPIKIDVRIIAATNRNLIHEVEKGDFREDLFYRIAVAVIRLPALRERHGDLNLLIDSILQKINQESSSESNYQYKELSVKARNIMLQHAWSGNFRELSNTLIRATLWSNKNTIDSEDLQNALFESPSKNNNDEKILVNEIMQNVDLQEIISKVAKHYLIKALEKSHGNKRKATELLGLKNYQTLNNWLEKYGINEKLAQ